MSELDMNQIAALASSLRAVSDATYPEAIAMASIYSSTASYDIGDFCVKSGLLYKCTTAIGSSGETWNSSHWNETALGDEMNDLRNSTIYISDSAPADPNIQFWYDTDETGASIVNSINNKNGTVVLDADDINAMHWDLLWENASSTSDFAAQTVEISLSEYTHVGILFVFSKTLHDFMPFVVFPVSESFRTNFPDNQGTVLWRTGSANVNGVTFTKGQQRTTGGTTSDSNSVVIPMYIFGINGIQI